MSLVLTWSDLKFIEHIYTGWASYNKYSPLAPSLKEPSKLESMKENT